MRTTDKNRPDAEIAAAWMAWTAHCSPFPSEGDAPSPQSEDIDDWGQQALIEVVCEDPARALTIVFLIARLTDDNWLLTNLGAGPIEDLLARDPTFLDPIAIEVRNSPNLRTALGSVWQNAMSDLTWRAVQRLAAG